MYSMEHESPTQMAEEGLVSTCSSVLRESSDRPGLSQDDENVHHDENEVVPGIVVTDGFNVEEVVVLSDGYSLQDETNVDATPSDSGGKVLDSTVDGDISVPLSSDSTNAQAKSPEMKFAHKNGDSAVDSSLMSDKSAAKVVLDEEVVSAQDSDSQFTDLAGVQTTESQSDINSHDTPDSKPTQSPLDSDEHECDDGGLTFSVKARPADGQVSHFDRDKARPADGHISRSDRDKDSNGESVGAFSARGRYKCSDAKPHSLERAHTNIKDGIDLVRDDHGVTDGKPVNLQQGVSHGDGEAGGPSGHDTGTPIHPPFSKFVQFDQLCGAGFASGAEMSHVDESMNNMQQEFWSLLNSDPRGGKRLKKLLRSARWSPSCAIRCSAWKMLCGHLHKLQGASVYFEVEKEMFGEFTDEDEILFPPWLQPQQQLPQQQALVDQFSDHFLTREGMRTAHKIVTVICHLSPDITYCPAMLPLIYLFLHYMDVADCFSCVTTLLASKAPVYLKQTKVASEASKHVLQDLAKKHTKSAFAQLVRNCANVDAVFDDWLLWIYCDLPFNYLVQLTDSYLLEGVKVLYRVGLAILMLFVKYSVSRHINTGMNTANSIRIFCRTIPVSPARLLKIAFGIRGLSRRRIWKLQLRNEANVSITPQHAGVPRVASSLSMGNVSMQVQTRTMGFQNIKSMFLTPDMIATVWGWLPMRFAITKPVMLFTSAEHGTSLMTLYSHIELQPYTIIFIQTTTDEVFGAFCAGAWHERRQNTRNISYFGTGETFLFTLVPERCKFEWVGILDPNVPRTANMFLAGDSTCLIIGGGNGAAISLDETMEHCRTESCNTFNNPPLCSEQDFTCSTVEVFGFQ